MCNNHAEVMQQQQIQPANIKPTVQYKDNIHVLEHTNIKARELIQYQNGPIREIDIDRVDTTIFGFDIDTSNQFNINIKMVQSRP